MVIPAAFLICLEEACMYNTSLYFVMVSIMAILEFLYSTMLKQLRLKTLSFFAGRGVRNPGFHTRRGNLTPLLVFSVCVVF